MKRYKFKATIQAGAGGGAYVVFPYDVEQEFGTKGKVPVNVTCNGVAYLSGLFKYGYPQHLLAGPKAVRLQIGKSPGDSVRFEVSRGGDNRTVEIPPDFLKLLKQKNLLSFFEQLSYTHRKEYCRWITEAKKDETRLRRLAKAVEMLNAGRFL